MPLKLLFLMELLPHFDIMDSGSTF